MISEDDLDIAATYLAKVLSAIADDHFETGGKPEPKRSPKQQTPYGCVICSKPIYTSTAIGRITEGGTTGYVHERCWGDR